MKRSIISLLVVGLCAGISTTALVQNAVAEEKPGDSSISMATEQKESTSPVKDDMAPTPDKSMHDKGDAAFKKADKDNDGTLDKAEAKAMPNVAKNFDVIDVDKDGTVSLDEIHTFMKAKHNAAQK